MTRFASVIILLALSILLQNCRSGMIDGANLKPSACAAKTANTCDWMSELMRAHPDVSLADICLPGAHDAGMYTTQQCTPFTGPANTQTQYLTFRNQLESGIRIYDLRPIMYQGTLYSHHTTKCDGLGCKGGTIQEILSDTRAFVDQHAEVVILLIGHWCHTSADDTAFISLVTSTLGDRIYRDSAAQLKSLPLTITPLRRIVPPGSRTGKVILLMEGVEDNLPNRSRGWLSERLLTTAGGWSDDHQYPMLRDHQLQRWEDYKGNGVKLFQLSWQITQRTPQAVRGGFDPHSPTTISKGAAKANAELRPFLDSLITSGSIRRGRIPNIIWDDLADTMVTHQCMRLTEIGTR